MGRRMLTWYSRIVSVLFTVIVGLLAWAYWQDSSETKAYLLDVELPEVNDLGMGSEVRFGGMTVGYVDDVELDPKTLRFLVRCNLDVPLALPVDSTARVSSEPLDGVLGAHIDLVRGSRIMRMTLSEHKVQAIQGAAVPNSSDSLQRIMDQTERTSASIESLVGKANQGMDYGLVKLIGDYFIARDMATKHLKKWGETDEDIVVNSWNDQFK